jgi:adenylate cyclase
MTGAGPFIPGSEQVDRAGPSRKVLRFNAFTLDPSRASLIGPRGALPLRPKAFDVLLYLARHPNRVVSKDELLEAVWPGVFVTENSLVQCISDIRAALAEDGPAILKTVAKRGYIFTAPVVEGDAAAEPPPSDSPSVPPPTTPVHAPRVVGRRAALAAVAGVLALAAAVGGWWWSAAAPERSELSVTVDAGAPQQRISIAVLPFTARDASDDDYLADGLTEDIISALARFPDVTVLAPKTVASYKGKTATPQEIARDLKVRYIAEGSVRRGSGRLRVSMRLADGSNGALIWADQYDTEADQVISVQDDITRHITGALAVRLTNIEQARIATKPPTSLQAYDLVLRGRDLLSRLTRTATSNARDMFERAIELDPNYAPAYVGLGRVDLVAVHLGWTPDPAGTLRRAEGHARKAIAIDEFNPAAHVLLGKIHTRLGEYDRAVDVLRHALMLNPSDPETYAGLGDALLWSGEIEEARKMLEIAARLDPKLPSQDLFNLGAAYFLLGQHTSAAQVFERTVARQDGNQFIHAMLAAIYADAGRKEDARREVSEVRRRNPMFDLDTFGTLFRNPMHREKIVAALREAGL